MNRDKQQSSGGSSEAAAPPKSGPDVEQVGNMRVPKPDTDDASDRNTPDDASG